MRVRLSRVNPAADGLLLLVLALVLRAPAIGLSEIDWDESSFALVAREILRGHWPYTTVFDHKPIGLYLHFAAALAIFGDNPTAVRLLGIVTAAVSALLVRYLAIGRLGLSRAWGFLLGASYLFATIGFDGQAVYSEHLVNLYVLLSLLLLSCGRESRIALSGFAAGVGISINYLAVPIIAGMAAGHLIALRSWRAQRAARAVKFAALFGLGAILGIALALSPIFLFSDPAEYFRLQFKFLSGYSAHRPIGGTLADFALQAAAFLPLAALAAGLAWAGRSRDESGDDLAYMFLGMGLGAAAAALASGYVYSHYLLLAVPAALLLVGSLAASAPREPRLLSAMVVAGTALMMAVSGVLVAAVGARNLVAQASSGRVNDLPRQLARIGRSRVQPGSTIYSVCAPLVLYQLLDARPATKFPFYMQTMNPQYASALGLDLDAEIAGVLAKHPALVVLGNYGNCWGIPQSSWLKFRDALRRERYTPFTSYEGYGFFVPPGQAGAADTR